MRRKASAPREADTIHALKPAWFAAFGFGDAMELDTDAISVTAEPQACRSMRERSMRTMWQGWRRSQTIDGWSSSTNHLAAVAWPTRQPSRRANHAFYRQRH